MVATRGAERRGRPHCGPSPQHWPEGGSGDEAEKRQEGEVHEENDGLRAQTTPLPGVRPAPLSEEAGPQAAVTVGYVAAGPPSLVVALVAVHDLVDQASVQFLL